MKIFLLACLLALTFSFQKVGTNQKSVGVDLASLEAAFTYLSSHFNTTSGTFDTTGWWNSANVQEVFLDFVEYIRKSKSSPKVDWEGLVKKQIETTYKKHINTSFLNTYYDDEGWWAFAWLKAYDVYKNTTYLQLSRTIFLDMVRGWDAGVCGGGIWWDKKKTYKNAIPNELLLSLSTRLYLRTNETVFLDWANQEYSWFYHTGMINAEWLINDGLNSTDPKSCTNNKGITWTYNQGVILGGLADLAVIQKNSAMIAIGEKIIDATLQKVVQNTTKGAVLLDKCELDDQGKQKDCGADGSQFKGIFMRYLAYFCESNKASATKYRSFASTQASIIAESNSRTESGQLEFGLHFAGPFDKADCSRQSSALDAVLTDLRLKLV